MPHRFLSPIEEVIEDARNGKMYILVDDEDRENEGDLIIPAQMATPEAVNFMAKYGRGLICLPMTGERIKTLGLPLMSQNNQSRHETAFTVSIEAREGVSTGISAADRARTIAVAIDNSKGAVDIATPGHVFPLCAKEGGVLVRAGHTEASVDISRLAGLNPSAVICEIMNDDGTMARLPDLVEFAKEHDLKVATIRDLIAYRLKHDNLVERVSETTLERETGHTWNVVVYNSADDSKETVAMVLGDINENNPVMVRMHNLNPFEDILGMKSPRTGQLERAMRVIEENGSGVVVLFTGMLRQRPSEVTAPNSPKYGSSRSKEAELKEYGVGARILRDSGVRHMILLSNTPSHIVGLEGYGLDIVEQREIPAE